METDQFNFPVSHIDFKKEYLQDIINPLTVQKDQIVTDMYVYSREFPTKIIPHITEIGEINDNIHNYKRPKMKENNFVKKETKKEPKKDEILKQLLTMKTNTNKSLQDDEDEEYEKPRKA